MGFFELLTPDNLVFFLVLLGNLAIVFIIIFLVVRAIWRFVKAILRKLFKEKPKEHLTKGVLADKGEDLGVYVEELEKSKRETTVVQKQSPTTHVKTPPLEYAKPIESEKKQEEKIDSQKEFQETEKKDIEAGLEKLKHPSQGGEKVSFLERQRGFLKGEELMPKIKIPVPKRHKVLGEPSETVEQETKKPEITEDTASTPASLRGGSQDDEAIQKHRLPRRPAESGTPRNDELEGKKKVFEVEKPEKLEEVVEQRPEAQKEQEFVEQTLVDPSERSISPVERAKAQKQPGFVDKRVSPDYFKLHRKKLEEEKVEKAGISPEQEQEISLYEKPEPIKKDLMVGRLKDRRKEEEKEKDPEQVKEEASKRSVVQEIKHPEKAQKKKSFWQKYRQKIFGGIPVPPKIEILVEKKEPEEEIPLYEKPEPLKNDLMVGRIKDRHKKQMQKFATKQEQEIPLYEKPDFMEDDLSPIERARTQKQAADGYQVKTRKAEEEYENPMQKNNENKGKGDIPLYEKPDFMKDELDIFNRQKPAKQDKSVDSVLFGKQDELTRVQLKHRLRHDPKVWKAGVRSRFNLTRESREKLEKQLFSKIYGRNISKQDFNRRIRMMKKEKAGLMAGGNVAKAETLRKEIKFLQKISGVKGDWKK